MFTNVLAGVDGRPGGHDAVQLARELAAPRAQIALVHFYGGSFVGSRGAAPVLERQASEQLLVRERDAASIDVELISYKARSVGAGLHEVAERRGADLVVVGSCHRGPVGRVLMGDDALASLNGARCAVALAPRGYAQTGHRLARVGIGYDGSPESDLALAAARELASRHGSTIRALWVASLQNIPYGEPAIQSWPKADEPPIDAAQPCGFEGIDCEVTYGQPSKELVRVSDTLDLLIVGSRSQGPAGRLFHGSCSNYLARHAQCPLLVLPRAAHSRTTSNGRVAGRITTLSANR